MRTQQEAWEIYNRARRRFPDNELPSANFEGCKWVRDKEGWSRSNGKATMTVLNDVDHVRVEHPNPEFSMTYSGKE